MLLGAEMTDHDEELHDIFALVAMHGLLVSEGPFEDIAGLAYCIAADMLEQRKRRDDERI